MRNLSPKKCAGGKKHVGLPSSTGSAFAQGGEERIMRERGAARREKSLLSLKKKTSKLGPGGRALDCSEPWEPLRPGPRDQVSGPKSDKRKVPISSKEAPLGAKGIL